MIKKRRGRKNWDSRCGLTLTFRRRPGALRPPNPAAQVREPVAVRAHGQQRRRLPHAVRAAPHAARHRRPGALGGTPPNLTDHESTRRRGRLEGVDLDEPVFFMDHVYTETKEGKGYVNRKEAEVAVELACYLAQRGYAVATITVLTTYRRQLRLLTQLIGAHRSKELRQLRATTVDSFQGEENDIIILSLVRSNADGQIGFLKMANRATAWRSAEPETGSSCWAT